MFNRLRGKRRSDLNDNGSIIHKPSTGIALLPEPYTVYNNPDLMFQARVACWKVPRRLPFHRLQLYPPVGQTSEQARLVNCELRVVAETFFSSDVKPLLSKWKQQSKCDIAEANCYVPRLDNLLQGWGIADLPTDHIAPKTNSIPVKLYFPVSCLGSRGAVFSKTSDSGCLSVTLNYGEGNTGIGASCLSETVPIILCFHGGGMTLKGSKSSFLSNDIMFLATKLMDDVRNEEAPIGGNYKSNSHAFVLACVDYSLAPEFQFPVAVEETLTVAQFFHEQFPNNPLHALGSTDAGANLALVMTLESHRCGKAFVRSTLAVCPMLDPAADSISYYMNSKSTPFPVYWSRWCWQAYLGLPQSQDGIPGTGSVSIADPAAILGSGSNRTTWLNCSYRDSPAERLIRPYADLPTGLGHSTVTTPKFIIVTSRGDPLYDEGVFMVRALERAGATVVHLEQKGMHFLGATSTSSIDSAILKRIKDLFWIFNSETKK